jgi:hypothetical protein
MTLKQKIHKHFTATAEQKVQRLQQVLAELKEAGTNETKSTAGDKHETALAMLQIEQANTRSQLREAQEQRAALEKINPLVSAPVVVAGSLVHTNNGLLFISTALGRAEVDGMTVIALSPQSPLGSKLIHAAPGANIMMNNISYEVLIVE